MGARVFGGILCDGGFGGCGILFGSERDLLTEMEVRVVGAALVLWLILVAHPLCLILANMEGLFGYTCCALLLSLCFSFTSIIIFAIFIAFWELFFFS